MEDSAARRALDEGASVEDIFLIEVGERLDTVEGVLANGFPPDGSEGITLLHRQAHTLKGLAGSLGYAEIERLAKEVVLAVAPLDRDGASVPEDVQALVRRDFEAIRREVDALARSASERAPRQP